MQEMNFNSKRTTIILDKGKYKGYEYFILSIGTHPTAYVRIPKGHKYYQKHYEDINIDCHGGLSFSENDFPFNPVVLEDIWLIGWDYAHSGDYIFDRELISLSRDNKKWTTKEILEEVKEIIEQLIEV